jgi:teichuronic acid biosynthesis protein TuaE
MRLKQFKVSMELGVMLLLISAVLGSGVSYSKVYLFHISAIILVVITIYKWRQKELNFCVDLPTSLHYPLMILFLWYCITFLWAPKTEYFLRSIFCIYNGLFLFLTIVFFTTTPQKHAIVFRVLTWIFVIEIIMSLLEVFTPFRMPVSSLSSLVGYFGRSSDLLHNLDESVLKYTLSRPTGFHWNINDLATAMAIIYPFFLAFHKSIIKWVGIVAIITVIVATASRGALAAIILMTVFYYLFVDTRYRKKIIVGMILIDTVGHLCQPSLAQSGNIRVSRFVTSIGNGVKVINEGKGENSLTIRRDLVRAGIKAFVETGGLGVGAGGSVILLKGERGQASMHNLWIEVLAESGVVGFSLFVWWYGHVLYCLWKVQKLAHDLTSKYYAKACLVSLIGFIVGAMVPSSVIYFFPMWLLFGFSVVTINRYQQTVNEKYETY